MKYLNLASGAAHFASPPKALEKTIAALHNNETFYGETEGLPALRDAISERYRQDFGAKVPATNVLITSGTKQALFNLFSVILKSGDEVILPKPSWFGFISQLEMLQVKIVWLETLPEEQYTLKPEKLRQLLTDKTRLFIYSNPGNPTGRLYLQAEIASWHQVLQDFPEVKILADEIYDQIIFDNQLFPSITQFPDPENKHLVVNGFSKNYGMSGWRIGYLIAPPAIMEMAIDFQHHTISGVNPFIQEGAVAAIESRKEFLPKRLEELAENRKLLATWLTAQPLLAFYLPVGAYYIFVDLSKVFSTAFCRKNELTTAAQLCKFLKQNYNLEFQPGDRFLEPNFIRVTFAVTKADLQEGLDRFATCLDTL